MCRAHPDRTDATSDVEFISVTLRRGHTTREGGFPTFADPTTLLNSTSTFENFISLVKIFLVVVERESAHLVEDCKLLCCQNEREKSQY